MTTQPTPAANPTMKLSLRPESHCRWVAEVRRYCRTIHQHLMKKQDRVLQQIRRLCLSLPESSETDSWGHPNFRAGKRTFATFEWIKGRPSIAFRLGPGDVDLLLRRKGFFATPYGQGMWVSLWADRSLNRGLVKRLLERSYRTVAIKRMIAALANKKEGS